MTAAPDHLALAQAGDTRAFAALVHSHQAMVFGAAYNFFRNAAWAEDIAQDVFLELYRNLATISCAEHLRAWLRRTVLCRCIDQSRRRAVRPEISLGDFVLPAEESREHDFLATDWLREQVAALPETQRVVVILRYQEELEPAAIAATLDLPVNTVKSRLHRALETLRSRSQWKVRQAI